MSEVATIGAKASAKLHVFSALKRLKYKFDVDEDAVFTLPFRGDRYLIQTHIFIGADYLVVHSYLPLTLPASAVDRLAIFSNQENIVIPTGGFEVDAEAGFRFRVGITIPPLPTDEQIDYYLTLAVSSLNKVSGEVTSILARY